MSTDTVRTFGRRHGVLIFALSIPLGCSARVVSELDAICASPTPAVEQPVILVIDSVRSAAPASLREQQGRRIPLRLVFQPARNPSASCQDREGLVTYEGVLPLALQGASAGSGNARWRLAGSDVVIEFNPGTADNNLGLSLPLTGGIGRWSLSTFPGEIASGRVEPDR
jgi:hypothetical protein